MVRRWLASISLTLFGLGISLGIVEIGVRYVLAHSQNKQIPNDRPKTYFFSEASKLTSDYLYSPEKPAHTFRIVTIGDSFTYGFGNLIDDSYPKRLEKILNLNINQQKVEVINFGVPGYSTKMEIPLFKKAIEQFHADLVILQVTLNDPEIKPYLAPRGVLGGKVGDSASQSGLSYYWKTFGLIEARIVNTASYSDYIKYYQNLFTDPDTLGSFNGALKQIQDICQGNSVPVVAMIFPLLSFPFDQSYPFANAHAVAHHSLESVNIPYIDLLDDFQGLDPIRMQAVPAGQPNADPHPSELAHRIATESLYEFLSKGNYIPEDVKPKCTSGKREGPSSVRCH